jgi:hypothetical protein
MNIIPGILLGIILIIIQFTIDRNKRQRNIFHKYGFRKLVAYHEAGHAVIGIFHGVRCTALCLNVTDEGQQINPQLNFLGAALTNMGEFHDSTEQIKKSISQNINFDNLPSDERTISFVKRYLAILYAGDIVLHKFFNVPKNELKVIDNRFSENGEDLQSIQIIREYLMKVGHSVTPHQAMTEVENIIDSHKEVRAAIHFLADTLLKNGDGIIREQEIIANLKMVNFFEVFKQTANKENV